jgi:cell division septation protein DedD
MEDEEFHEIQLNGKQLVFLFMAGTVAAVVIFLCGLMVGRNLRVPHLQAAAATVEEAAGDPTRAEVPPPVTEASGTPVTVGEELTYSPRLEAPNPIEDTLQPIDSPTRRKAQEGAAVGPAATAGKASAPRVATKDLPREQEAYAAAASDEPAGSGWVLQVQAVTSRAEADALARRLNSKGYPTFVAPRGSGSLTRYGVRVGKYEKKGDAEAIKARLEKEEQFTPWLTH